jgi:hypothetical protein
MHASDGEKGIPASAGEPPPPHPSSRPSRPHPRTGGASPRRTGPPQAAADGTLMARLGKKAAGRLLDGAELDGLPAAVAI